MKYLNSLPLFLLTYQLPVLGKKIKTTFHNKAELFPTLKKKKKRK